MKSISSTERQRMYAESQGMAFIERDREKWDLGLWALKW